MGWKDLVGLFLVLIGGGIGFLVMIVFLTGQNFNPDFLIYTFTGSAILFAVGALLLKKHA